jgi:hypothetical protein
LSAEFDTLIVSCDVALYPTHVLCEIES